MARSTPDPGVAREARLKALFDSPLFGALAANEDGLVTEANAAFLSLVGRRQGELPLAWEELIAPEARELHRTKIAQAAAEAAPVAWETQYLGKNDSRLPARTSVAHLGTLQTGYVATVLPLADAPELNGEPTEDQLRDLAYELSLAEDRERRRIAAGLHDDIGPTLAAVHLGLRQLLSAGRLADVRRLGQDLETLIAGAEERIHTLIFELGSPTLFELGFTAAVESLGDGLLGQHGIGFQLETDSEPAELSEDLQVLLFGIVRELLVNAEKHAQAQSVRVAMTWGGGALRMEVQDDGVGFETAGVGRAFSPEGGYGLFRINEQLKRIGGQLTIESTPGKGTRVAVLAPIDEQGR